MESERLYDDYARNQSYMESYIQYQKRYFEEIRQSDKKLLELVARELDRKDSAGGGLLDIGCSTGAFLLHLRRAFPNLRLFGGDLSETEIQESRRNTYIQTVQFEVMDIRSLHERGQKWDIITANAILYGFGDHLFERAIASIGKSLRKEGVLAAFGFFHPFAQEVEIIERSSSFPQGHPLHFRSYAYTRRVFENAGFGSIIFHPFEIPIDLPHPGFESIRTHTVATKEGRRLQFRGALFQPWCHLVARIS